MIASLVKSAANVTIDAAKRMTYDALPADLREALDDVFGDDDAPFDAGLLYSYQWESNAKPEPPIKHFTPIGDLIKNRVHVEQLVAGYLPKVGTGVLLGESGAGKTFLMLDISLHIANGLEWQGQKTKSGAVFYIPGEGQHGIPARCQAWAITHGVDLENTPFYCADGAVIPTDPQQFEALINGITEWIDSTGEQPALVVFDTLARCFDGNENDSKDAGAYVRAMDAIKERFNCCVVSVHHHGKDTTRGGRGSSAFKAAWDFEHTLVDEGGVKVLKTTKLKDGEPKPDKAFRLESVELDWLDEDGEAISSAVMVSAGDAMPVKQGKTLPPLDVTSQNILTALCKAINERGVEPLTDIRAMFSIEPHKCPANVVHIDGFRDAAYKYLNVGENSKRNTLRRIIEKLEKYNKAMFYNDYLWSVTA